MKSLHAVDPFVESAKLQGGSVVVTVGGLGNAGIAVVTGTRGFEVLGSCVPEPTPGSCDGQVLCFDFDFVLILILILFWG
jgi:hypothetical protein